jgi:hypothetical protein
MRKAVLWAGGLVGASIIGFAGWLVATPALLGAG